MTNDYDPTDRDRPPRSEGWREETERVAELLHDRGDQRIGQLIMNAIRLTADGTMDPEELEQILWNMEAPELVDKLEELMDLKTE